LAVRLEEVELNAVAGSKRIISKLESRLRDLELECDEEKRKHSETIKILRKKERTVKEVLIQCEEDQKNINILQETLEKATHKINAYKRQLADQVSPSFFLPVSHECWFVNPKFVCSSRRVCQHKPSPVSVASNGNSNQLKTVPNVLRAT
jgi:Myosin tail